MKQARFPVRTGVIALALTAVLALGQARALAAQDGPMAFDTPDKAVAALIDAAKKMDKNALLTVLGPATKEWIISGDTVQDEQARSSFVAAYDEKHVLRIENDTKATLLVGDDEYPFPIPMAKTDKGWAFDPEQGKEEILARRIGENELTTIQVLLAISDAQREYASVDRDDNGLLEYAAKFRSSEGSHDGLYWPTAENEPLSPLGPLVVRATAEGYAPGATRAGGDGTSAFHGYRFKLLTKQGPDAHGGAHDYMVDGKMIGGFAVLAWPAKYGASGIMAFTVSHDGQVYETDLGPETEARVKTIDVFNPDQDWTRVDPE